MCAGRRSVAVPADVRAACSSCERSASMEHTTCLVRQTRFIQSAIHLSFPVTSPCFLSSSWTRSWLCLARYPAHPFTSPSPSCVQLDKILACVEDIDRGEPPRFKQRCDQALKLEVRAASCAVALLAVTGAAQCLGVVGTAWRGQLDVGCCALTHSRCTAQLLTVMLTSSPCPFSPHSLFAAAALPAARAGTHAAGGAGGGRLGAPPLAQVQPA